MITGYVMRSNILSMDLHDNVSDIQNYHMTPTFSLKFMILVLYYEYRKFASL